MCSQVPANLPRISQDISQEVFQFALDTISAAPTQKIQCIRAIKFEFDLGLKDAKDYFDAAYSVLLDQARLDYANALEFLDGSKANLARFEILTNSHVA